MPPTYKSLAIPAPPDKVRAPEEILEELVSPVPLISLTNNCSPTYKFLPMPAPPTTLNTPVVVLKALVLLTTFTVVNAAEDCTVAPTVPVTGPLRPVAYS